MESIQQPNELILTGNLAEHWRKFKQEFTLYLIATGLDNKSEEQKMALLLHVVKSSAIEVYNTFDSTNEASSETFANVLDKFEKYYNPKKNITYETERYIFFTRNQESGEPVESFVTDLMLKAKTCEFLTLRDSLIKDRIVLCIISQRVNKCSKFNHFARYCTNNKQVHMVEEDDYVFVGVIKNQEMKVNNWQQKINVCDVPMNFKLDTGSDANILSLNMLKLIQPMPEVSKSSITMRAYNGGYIPSIGEAKVTLSYKNNIIESTMQIIKQCRQPILGAIDCKNLNIVKRVNAVVTDSVANVRQKYPELFMGHGSLPGEHSFVLKEDVTPVIHAARRVAVAKREDLKIELDHQVKLGFISKQDQPTDWVNSLVITEKKNGQIRLCL